MMNKDDMTLSIFNVGNLSGDDGDCVQALTICFGYLSLRDVSFIPWNCEVGQNLFVIVISV